MKLNERDRGFLEGYARALTDLQYKLTGESFCSKSYDPMTIEGDDMLSYAFDLKDGSRRHPIDDYSSVEEVCELMLAEIMEHLSP